MHEEFWITEDGNIYCDGDQGVDVPNHEAVVRSRCLSMVLDAMDNSDEPRVKSIASSLRYMEDEIIDQPMLCESLINLADEMCREGTLAEDEADDIKDFIKEYIEIEDWVFDVGLCRGEYDERKHAIIMWGWIRVAGNAVDSPRITSAVLDAMSEGLWEAYEDECYRMKFFIDQPGAWNPDVPYSAIEGKDLSFFRQTKQEALL